MFRFTLNVYDLEVNVFSMEFKSITSVAKCIDRFNPEVSFDFELIDNIKSNYIDVNELMRIWHA